MTSLPSRIEILVGGSEHLESCLQIGRRLPEYFDETGLEQRRRSLSSDFLYAAVENEQVIGFATIGSEEDGTAEIHWLAVNPSRQGEGIGHALVKRIEEDLAGKAAKLLTVKTLAEDANYPPYEATRTFYEKNGFGHADTIHSNPDWNGDPAAVYMKELSTREAKCN